MVEYYLLWYRLNDSNGYLIWASDDQGQDRLVLNKVSKLNVFSEPSQALRYANQQGWKLEDESPITHNLDVVRIWLNQPASTDIECVEFLRAWNLFTDVSFSIAGKDFLVKDDRAQAVYAKIFWGNNLPSATPVGRSYEPIWNLDEVSELAQLLTMGMDMFLGQVIQQY